MRHRWRSSRKANPETLDKARNAAHVHVERVACAERRELLRIRGAVDQLRSELAEIVLEPGWRYDFQYPGGRVAGVPKRVPLSARLADQVSRITDDNGISKQRPDAAREDETIFVLAMMPVHRRRQGARLHRMLHKREAFASVVPCNNKPSTGAPQNCEVAIMRT